MPNRKTHKSIILQWRLLQGKEKIESYRENNGRSTGGKRWAWGDENESAEKDPVD
jgi:hypothetical protein